MSLTGFSACLESSYGFGGVASIRFGTSSRFLSSSVESPMNTSRSRIPKRYSNDLPANFTFPGNPHGGTGHSGLHDRNMQAALGLLTSLWTHVETAMITVLGEIIDNHDVAKQVFRSIVAPKVRIEMMRNILEKSPRHKDTPYSIDNIIDEYSELNAKRNDFIHGMWWTWQDAGPDGQLQPRLVVYLEPASADDQTFFKQRVVEIAEINDVIRRMDDLTRRAYFLRRQP